MARPRVSGCRGGLAVAAFAGALLAAPSSARAQASPPGAHEDDAFDVMNVLSHAGAHDLEQESWNLYGQFTYISSWKLGFSAPYTNENGSTSSLLTDPERSFTSSFTLFFGARLWPGAQAYLVPEVIAEDPLSGLHGLGGAIQNFELQKTGSATPQLYRSRTFVSQTIDLGGEPVVKESQPMSLGTVVKSRRLVLTAGNFSILDFFSKDTVNWDPRQTFFNMAFQAYSSWDFPSDARGYSYGGVAELYYDDWAVRYARITPPVEPNQLAVDFHLFQFYGDEVELEHDHKLLGQDGAVRVVGYRNSVDTGSFSDAIAAYRANPMENAAACTSFNYGSQNVSAPDLCWVRKPNQKLGVGLEVEQHLAPDVGVFFRGMYSDGLTEVDAYNSADRSISLGLVGKGSLWHRRFDVAGVGFGLSWISAEHAQYLAMGGVDGFVGDGYLHQAAEGVTEAFYSVNLFRSLWLSGDYQFLWNPGFNADRGPVHILGGRVHAEF